MPELPCQGLQLKPTANSSVGSRGLNTHTHWHTPSLWGSSLWDEDPSSSIPSTSICDDSTDPVLFYPTKRHRKGRQSAFTVLSRGKYQLIEHQVCKGCEELASLLSCSIMSTAWSTRGRAAARQSVNSSQHLTWFNRHVSVTVAVISTAMLATKKEENRAEIFWICHCVLKGKKKTRHVICVITWLCLWNQTCCWECVNSSTEVVLFLDSDGSTTFDMTVFNVGTKYVWTVWGNS